MLEQRSNGSGDNSRRNRDELHPDEFPKRWLYYLFLGAALYALYRMAQTVLLPLDENLRLGVAQRLIVSAADACLMAAFATVAWQTCRRFPVSPPHLIRNVTVHVLVALGSAALWMVALMAFFAAVTRTALVSPLQPEYIGWITTNLFAYSLSIAVLHALSFQHRARLRELQAARLQTQLTSARLETLKAQLQPHFLFNTLHNISELIHTDPRGADAMVIRLAQLLRTSLDFAGRSEIPLGREIELVSSYLEIQRMRYGDRLTVSMSIQPSATDALVPPMILQPLVENSLRHGIAVRSAPGTIWVTATTRDARLSIVVEDDGAGLPPAVQERVGLSNVRTRLSEQFGSGHRLSLVPREGGGTVATIEVPLHTG